MIRYKLLKGQKPSSFRVKAIEGKMIVGSLTIGNDTVSLVQVIPTHQRLGIATAMWFMAKRQRPQIRHSADRTPEGDAWAKTVGGPVPPLCTNL